jgi:hypothetical protein
VKKEGDLGEIAWENIVQGISKVFENWKKEQVATKIPIEGKFDQPNTDLWTAINYVLRNAFVYALKPSIDNDINIGKVEEIDTHKTLLQKIFGKKDKKDSESKEKDEGQKKDKKNTEDGKEADKKSGNQKEPESKNW